MIFTGSPPNFCNMIGKRFGHLIVVAKSDLWSNAGAYWNCLCDCGAKKGILGTKLRQGRTVSCGQCLRVRRTFRQHGRNPIYSTWASMIRRCHDSNAPQYTGYGARGIIVCDEWRNSFRAFASAMGEKPSAQHSLDRIDNNGNYEPGNCRWATSDEQHANRRITRFIEYNGIKIALALLHKQKCPNIPYRLFRGRIRLGWTVEHACTEKRYARGHQHDKNN